MEHYIIIYGNIDSYILYIIYSNIESYIDFLRNNFVPYALFIYSFNPPIFTACLVISGAFLDNIENLFQVDT